MILIRLLHDLKEFPFGNEKFMILQPFANYLKRIKNPENFRKGIDMIVSFRDTIEQEDRQQIAAYFNFMILSGIASSKQSKGLTEQADYVKSKLPGNTKSNEAQCLLGRNEICPGRKRIINNNVY